MSAASKLAEWPAVVVHAAPEASLALAASAGRGVVLLSAPGAAGSLGAPWFLAMVAAAQARHPGLPCLAVLDCGDAPGHVMPAIAAGARCLVLNGACAAWSGLQGAAAEAGALLVAARPPALDLGEPGAARLLAQWLLSQWFARDR